MTFASPELLWLFASIPVLIGMYVWLLRRRQKIALRHADLAMIKAAVVKRRNWRRHMPPLLFLLALASIIFSVARPAASVPLPQQRAVIVLAVDVSASMLATDMTPNRLVAVQNALRQFVQQQPEQIRIGIVAFWSQAVLTLGPTNNRDEILTAINLLSVQPGTAIGSGILEALAALFQGSVLDLQIANPQARTFFRARNMMLGQGIGRRVSAAEPGTYPYGAIVLLTDGQNQQGPDPIGAAMVARDLGVQLFTVGLGTPQGAVVEYGGVTERVRLDSEPLEWIAEMTQASYFQAKDAADLMQVYDEIGTRIVLEYEEIEVTALFSMLGGLLILLAGGLSLLWFGRR